MLENVERRKPHLKCGRARELDGVKLSSVVENLATEFGLLNQPVAMRGPQGKVNNTARHRQAAGAATMQAEPPWAPRHMVVPCLLPYCVSYLE